MTEKKILILLPTLPHYRNDFFTSLFTKTKDKYSLLVLHGDKFNGKEVKYEKKDYDSKKYITSEYNILGYNVSYQKRLFTDLKSYKPDGIIMLFNPGILSYWLITAYCIRRKIPFGIWSCGFIREDLRGIKRKIRTIIVNYFLKKAKSHICYGSKYSSQLLRDGLSKNNIYVVQNTINIESIIKTPMVSKERAREKLKLDSSIVVFIFVGAIIRAKKLNNAIKAFQEIKLQNHTFKFLIIGNGKEKNNIMDLIESCNLKNEIHLIDGIYGKELSTYYCAADAFILPGTGGLAINEAMAYKLPIISSEGDGTIIDLVTDSVNGFIISNDFKSIENACLKFMKMNPHERLRMGEESQNIIKTKASLKNMVESYHNSIEHLFDK